MDSTQADGRQLVASKMRSAGRRIGRKSTQPFRHKASNKPINKNYRCAILCDVVRFRFSDCVALKRRSPDGPPLRDQAHQRAHHVRVDLAGDPRLSTCGSGSTLHLMTDLTLEM